MALSTSQQNVLDSIVDYGRNHGFSEQQIQTAVDVAYIESSLGENLDNPNSTASGLYQYLDGSWHTYYNDLGDKNNQDNQIKAFYTDLDIYSGWYSNSETNSNIPSDMTLEEYVYTKHHDGRSYSDFENAPGRDIYNDAMTDSVRDDIGISPTVLPPINPDDIAPPPLNPPPPRDPLVLDTDKDGFISTVSLQDSNAYFDMKGDGMKQKVSWIESNDGILVYDKDENKKIDGLNEVFGNADINGFTELKQLIDSNGDGTVDESSSSKFMEVLTAYKDIA